MALTLRPYQSEIISQARTLMAGGEKRILITAPTGSGKTALTAEMLAQASKKNKRSFFNVHRRELIMQSLSAFTTAEVAAGVIASSFPFQKGLPVYVASIQSLARRLSKLHAPDLIVWDECHHIAAGTWDKIFKYYPKAFHVGLTATPERLDGKGLDKHFNVMIKGPSVSWLIENKFLADYKAYVPSGIDTSQIKKTMGDFNKTQLNDLMDKPTITGSAVNEYLKAAKGKRAVVFCVSIKHSEHVVDEFNRRGITAEHVDGTTPQAERDARIKRFRDGETLVLSNVELFGEGFDLPAIEVCIMLRPTQSLSLYLQQVGRSLRPSPGKTHSIILDHVGNIQRHGLPDQEREWHLLGKKGRLAASNGENNSVKVCSFCFAAQAPGYNKCIHCYQLFEKKDRKIEEVEGDLTEIDKKTFQMKKKREQGKAQTLEELYAVGVSRGYKRPRSWAQHIFNARQAKKLKGLG